MHANSSQSSPSGFFARRRCARHAPSCAAAAPPRARPRYGKRSCCSKLRGGSSSREKRCRRARRRRCCWGCTATPPIGRWRPGAMIRVRRRPIWVRCGKHPGRPYRTPGRPPRATRSRSGVSWSTTTRLARWPATRRTSPASAPSREIWCARRTRPAAVSKGSCCSAGCGLPSRAPCWCCWRSAHRRSGGDRISRKGNRFA